METFDKRNQYQLLLRLLSYLKPFWDKYLLVIILLVIQGTIHTLPVLLISKLPVFIDQGTVSDYLKFCFLLLLPTLTFRWVIFDSLLYTLVWYIGLKLAFKFRLDLYRHIEKLSLSFYQSRPVGEHLYRANFDIDAMLPILNSTQDGIPGFFSSVYQMLLMAYLVSIAGIDILFYLTLLLIPVYFIVHIMYTVVQRLDYRKRARAQELEAILRQSIAGIRVIKAFNRIKYTSRRYFHAMVNYYKTGQATYFMQFAADQVRVSPIHIIWPLSLPFFAYLGLKGEIPIITWGSIIYFSRLLLYYLDGTYKFFQKFRLYLVPAKRLFETFDIQPEITEPPQAQRIEHLKGDIQFTHINFAYQPGHPVLRDISFEAPTGKKVAIIGPSGAGKSTIAMLLMRLYQPDSGQIKIDNLDIQDVKMQSVLSQTGVILQDTFLFGGTIRDNIRYAKPEATDTEIENAAKSAGLHNDILNMPRGYETDVAEGASLSGGQKQRIAIARALLKNPKLLILDEATSSLDVTTEWGVMNTLRENFADITTLIISHRLNTILDADHIIVIEKGAIIDQGTHAQLLKKCHFYKQLYQQQANLIETKQG